jgi:hypothetical protein
MKPAILKKTVASQLTSLHSIVDNALEFRRKTTDEEDEDDNTGRNIAIGATGAAAAGGAGYAINRKVQGDFGNQGMQSYKEAGRYYGSRAKEAGADAMTRASAAAGKVGDASKEAMTRMGKAYKAGSRKGGWVTGTKAAFKQTGNVAKGWIKALK